MKNSGILVIIGVILVVIMLSFGTDILQPANIVQSENSKKLVMFEPGGNEYWYAQSFKPDKSYIKNIMVQVRWEGIGTFYPRVSVYLVESLTGWDNEDGEGTYITKKDCVIPLKNGAFPAILSVSHNVDISKTYWIIVRPKSYTEDKDTLYLLASSSTNPYNDGVLKQWNYWFRWSNPNLAYDMAFVVSTEDEIQYVTCYQCQNNEIVDDEFENSCPTGWSLTPPNDCDTNGDDVTCWSDCVNGESEEKVFQSSDTVCGQGAAVAYPHSTEPDCDDGVTVKIWAKDSSSALLEDAEITLANSAGNAIKRTTTATGFVQFLNMPAGSYTVTGKLVGYTTTGADLTLGSTDIEETLTFTPSAIPGFEALLFMVSLLGVVFIIKKKRVKM